MKKNIFFALFSAMLLMTACQQHEIDSPADLGDGFTLVGHSDAQTKTAFGTPDANTIPFLWSEGDKIWSNGAQSEAASVSNDGATALFSFTSGSMADQVYYNMTGASATGAHVKSEQSIGNLGANGDFGYATVSEGSFTLDHATAYLWFNVTSDIENATLESVMVNAYGANIAGKATWNGTSFENLTEASNSVTLTVGETLSSTNENVWAMVIFPSALTGAKVTYKLTVGGQTKYFDQELTSGKTLTGGETARISANITSEGLYELRVLTFEDDDAKFPGYVLDYCSAEISTWSDLIDKPQYGGPMTYGYLMNEAAYTWYDEGNTELYHMFPDQWGAYCFWGGGHAISNYWGEGFDDEDRNKHIAKYYGEDYVTENAGNDQMLGWFNLQLMVPVQAHSGNNFAVHYGYLDDDGYGIYQSQGGFSMCEKLVELSFRDETPRIIDHMYVTNTNYTLNQLYNGVKSEAGNTFGGSWEGLNDDAWLMLVAYGFESINDDTPATSTEFYLVKGQDVVTDWKKWDLSSLGAVAKVQFNFIYSDDMGGTYGFTIPGYFAYDDVAVRFPVE